MIYAFIVCVLRYRSLSEFEYKPLAIKTETQHSYGLNNANRNIQRESAIHSINVGRSIPYGQQ